MRVIMLTVLASLVTLAGCSSDEALSPSNGQTARPGIANRIGDNTTTVFKWVSGSASVKFGIAYVTETCPKSYSFVLNGGYSLGTSTPIEVLGEYPNKKFNGWVVLVYNSDSNKAAPMTAYAVCTPRT
jgi:hypothetical protein